jgi:hypothetical protein
MAIGEEGSGYEEDFGAVGYALSLMLLSMLVRSWR